VNTSNTIRARVKLPCSIRLNGDVLKGDVLKGDVLKVASDLTVVRGVTEELTRESVVVVAPSVLSRKWLKPAASVYVSVELPSEGTVEPRVLECVASISEVRAFSNKVRIVAEIQRMAVIEREPEKRTGRRTATHSCAAGTVPAVPRSQNDDPVILVNHPTKIKSNSTGEHTMSFLKKFFIEEEGQDMIEYGLVAALVVIAGAVAYTSFGGAVSNGINSLTANVQNVFK
jgi:Flp pilus assembly pilin Flp